MTAFKHSNHQGFKNAVNYRRDVNYKSKKDAKCIQICRSAAKPFDYPPSCCAFFQQTNDVQYKESGADICKYICKYYTSVFWQDYQRKTLWHITYIEIKALERVSVNKKTNVCRVKVSSGTKPWLSCWLRSNDHTNIYSGPSVTLTTDKKRCRKSPYKILAF